MGETEKIGQLFLFGFEGLEPDERILRFIRDGGLGGIILFSRNIKDPLQTAKLVEQLQGEAKIPLFVGIDQEG
ncbi:MAG: glycoside hydrolase family 3 N-terminal domain-containing protein, partial [bacterium]|nr:glycoside hydrolase family 3 N-terminal domain-containing protein [bacterium]